MRKLGYTERWNIYLEYRNIDHPIVVGGFESAIMRCKQEVCKSVKKQRALYKRKARQRQEVKDKEYAYRGKILRKEVDIPSGEKIRSFVITTKKKYGSIYNYHFSKENKWYKVK